MKNRKYIGKILNMDVYSSSDVPEGKVVFEEHHKINPFYQGGLLDTIGFINKKAFVKGKKEFNKLANYAK